MELVPVKVSEKPVIHSDSNLALAYPSVTCVNVSHFLQLLIVCHEIEGWQGVTTLQILTLNREMGKSILLIPTSLPTHIPKDIWQCQKIKSYFQTFENL